MRGGKPAVKRDIKPDPKYGSVTLVWMMSLTAFFTGVLNVLLFSTGLLGASGIVFMLIILVSIVDVKAGSIPLTFVLVAGIFIGTEVFNAFQADNISHLGHIIGGTFGALFGFMFTQPLKRKPKVPKSRQ